MPPRIAFVTWKDLPELTPSDRSVLPFLKEMGIEGVPAVWDDPQIAWNTFDRVVIRSCWDYHLRPAEFSHWLAQLEHSGAAVQNPIAILRWNLNKIYLRELQERGIRVPPTVWLPQGSSARLAAILAEQGWERAVVKPAISASAHETWVATPGTAAAHQPQLEAMLAHTGVLVQQFLNQVVEQGEWSFIFLNRRYSHAVLKTPAPGDFRVDGAKLAHPLPELIAQAQAVLDAVPQPLLYARVDGVEAAGKFILSELELIEPHLFFDLAPGSARTFAQVLGNSLLDRATP